MEIIVLVNWIVAWSFYIMVNCCLVSFSCFKMHKSLQEERCWEKDGVNHKCLQCDYNIYMSFRLMVKVKWNVQIVFSKIETRPKATDKKLNTEYIKI